MIFVKKTFRYYYWLAVEFVKKHLRIIIISFLLSFILIVSLVSFAPYIQSLFSGQREIIGMVGDFDYNSLPPEITGKISSGLLYVNEKGEFIPAIASNWEVLEDGTVYRFNIRDGLLWSDGTRFSASEIDYQFKDISFDIIDAKTIQFKLKKSLPVFPTYLLKPIIKFPLVGVAGLFKVDRIRSNYGIVEQINLSPNKKELPLLVYKFYKSEAQMINAYKQGEINQMKLNKKSVADVFGNWKNTSVSKTTDYSKLLTLYFNFKNKLLAEKEVRQAITMAIDESEFSEFGEIAFGPVPPDSWAYSSSIKPPVFDLDSAQRILNKAKTASLEAALNLHTYYDYLNDAELIAAELKAAGLQVKLKLVSSRQPSDFDLFLAFWNLPSDPDQYFFWHSTQQQGNLGAYKNVKIDKLLEDARNTSIIDERKRLYLEFQKVIADDSPAVFLYFPYIYSIKRK